MKKFFKHEQALPVHITPVILDSVKKSYETSVFPGIAGVSPALPDFHEIYLHYRYFIQERDYFEI